MTNRLEMRIFMNVQNFFNKCWNKISGNCKIAFFTTFIAGLLTNLFVFTNKLVNHDDLINEFNYNDAFDITCGRWMWIVLRKIPTYYGVPVVKGLLACLLLAISVALIVHIFSINETIFVLILSCIFASYPINACFFSYLSISEIYYFANMFCVLAAFIMSLDKIHFAIRFLLSSLLICLALATYQSMLCLFVGIVFIMAFNDVIKDHFDLKKWFFKYLKYAISAVAGYIIYYVTTKIILFKTGLALRAYAGTDKMFSFNFKNLYESIMDSYHEMYNYFLTKSYVNHRPFVLANLTLFVVFVVLCVMIVAKLIKSKKTLQAVVCVTLIITTPIFVNLIYVIMNGKSSAHILMLYSNILMYPLVITTICKANIKAKIVSIFAQWLTLFGCMAIIYYGIIVSNQIYQRMYYNTKGMDGVAITFISQLATIDNWTVDEPIYFAGFENFFNENYYSATPFSQDLPPYVWIGTDVYPWYFQEHLIRYINNNQHILIKEYNVPGCESIEETEEFKQMPAFPNAGSIKRIDGVLVAKFHK